MSIQDTFLKKCLYLILFTISGFTCTSNDLEICLRCVYNTRHDNKNIKNFCILFTGILWLFCNNMVCNGTNNEPHAACK